MLVFWWILYLPNHQTVKQKAPQQVYSEVIGCQRSVSDPVISLQYYLLALATHVFFFKFTFFIGRKNLCVHQNFEIKFCEHCDARPCIKKVQILQK